jgi:hypothetical protein
VQTKTKIHMKVHQNDWFGKFLACIWLFSLVLLTFGVNHAFISDIRDFQGKMGLLKKPTTEAIEWKINTYVESLFKPISANAQQAVVCIGGCLSGEAYLASRVSERAEITLLRSILTAFVRTVLNFIQNTVLTIIKQLTNAQDQFNFLRSIGQYAEQAVLLASKQAYNCASDSITTWSYNLFGDTPPETSEDSCKFGIINNNNPNENDIIGATQDVIDQCAVLSYSATKPIGCTDSEIKDLQNQSEEVLKEKILNECSQAYTPPLFQELAGPYACGGTVTEQLIKYRQESQARTQQVSQAASLSLSSYNQSVGKDAAFITADTSLSTPNSTNSADAAELASNPVFYPANLDVFDSSTSTLSNLKIGFAKDPEANKAINDYTIAGINSKPQPSGESDSLATVIQDTFKGFLDQLLQKLQEMLFSFLNNLIAKLDVATGGSGVFSSLLSDITGSVKTYAKTKVNTLYNDITAQRESLVASLSQKKKVLSSTSGITFVP